MIDFEIGFHNALREVFQIDDYVIVGCLFHLGQCAYRKVQGLDLSGIYLHNEDIRLKCKMFVALAFIPAEYVIEAFETLSDDIEDALIPLFDYFEDTWIGRPGRHGIRRNPLFPIRVWSIFQRVIEGLPRTNNSIEGWHLTFQGTVGTNHPTIYKLIEATQLEQSHTENLVTMIGLGRTVLKKHARYERIDRAYSTVVASHGRRDTLDY